MNMKRNGFTIIEMVFTVVVLVIVLLIVSPVISNVVENGKSDVNRINTLNLQEAGKDWNSMFSGSSEVTVVLLEDLIEEEIITPIYSPWTGEECNREESLVIITRLEDETYEYEPVLVCDGTSSVVIVVPEGNDDYEATDDEGGYGVLDGSGTEDDPYEIGSIEDLVQFGIDVDDRNTYSNQYVELGGSLDFNYDGSYGDPTTTVYGDLNDNGIVEELQVELTTGDGFNPIGGGNNRYFQGFFSGGGYTIKNLTVTNSVSSDSALFGEMRYGRLESIVLEDININGDGSTSAFVSSAIGGEINNIEIKNGTITSEGVSSGFVGTAVNTSFNNITTNVTVINDDEAVGFASSCTNCHLNNVEINGDIIVDDASGSNEAAGISTSTRNGDFTDIVVNGNVTAIGSENSEAAGFANSTQSSVISNVTIAGNILSDGDSSGISNNVKFGSMTGNTVEGDVESIGDNGTATGFVKDIKHISVSDTVISGDVTASGTGGEASGFVSWVTGVSIDGVEVSGAITGYASATGIATEMQQANFSDLAITGSVTSTSAGSVASGLTNEINQVSINNIYVSADISGRLGAFGLFDNVANQSSVSNVYISGSITSVDPNSVSSGFCDTANKVTVSNGFVASPIISANGTSGTAITFFEYVSSKKSSGLISNVFEGDNIVFSADEVFNVTTIYADEGKWYGTIKNEIDFRTPSFYPNFLYSWDFTNTWDIVDGDYPTLK